MKNTKLLIFFVTIFFSANSYAKDIHTNINDLIAENQHEQYHMNTQLVILMDE